MFYGWQDNATGTLEKRPSYFHTPFSTDTEKKIYPKISRGFSPGGFLQNNILYTKMQQRNINAITATTTSLSIEYEKKLIAWREKGLIIV